MAITEQIKLFSNYTITRDRNAKTGLDIQTNANGSIMSISPVYDGKEIDNIAVKKETLESIYYF